MYTLLLDSSNSDLSVGISSKGELVDFVTYEAWQRQSELMVDEIDKMLDKHNLTRSDLSAVVVSKGPGSYTGVRIALTVAKVTAFALNIPLYLVSSLEAIKNASKPCLCLSNARSKRSYVAAFDGKKCLMEDTIMDNEEVKKYLEKHPEMIVAGETDYLGIKGEVINPLLNLKDLEDDAHKCPNVLSAKPVYLKDAYPV